MDRVISSAGQAVCHRPAPSLLSRVFAWDALFRNRAQLARLDDAALNDLGLSRNEALREANRPVWDAPNHWHGR